MVNIPWSVVTLAFAAIAWFASRSWTTVIGSVNGRRVISFPICQQTG
ncbi:hypothetical protein GOA53_26850 [Sinorhizobium meliloti]|nr:hypothetical protein [Sinorhizobium meliloti]MDW9433025.1 hypothetical protein [Sinorhizobium meliloti]MQV76852.1 hypothetical protein [Sinorhizobium meliloti]